MIDKGLRVGAILKNNWEVIDKVLVHNENTNETETIIETKCLKCGYTDKGLLDELVNRRVCRNCTTISLQHMVGQKFGRLTVINISLERHNSGHIQANCLCDCGNHTTVTIHRLENGTTRSCGCLAAEGTNYSHRQSNTRLYKIWKGIRTRCYNPNSEGYKRYGAKGIKMCKEWFDDFMNFYRWAQITGYNDNLSIERKYNDRDYEPSNCIWIPMREQQFNKGNTNKLNIVVNINGSNYTLLEIAHMYNIYYSDVIAYYDFGMLQYYINDIYNKHMQNIAQQINKAELNEPYKSYIEKYKGCE